MRKNRSAIINEIFYGEEVARLTRECNTLKKENDELTEKVNQADMVSKESMDTAVIELEAKHKAAILNLQNQHKQQTEVLQMLMGEENLARKKIEK